MHPRYTPRRHARAFLRSGLRRAWILLLPLLLISCSTKKNTSGTRFYHAMMARFNTLHNGQMAYKEGQEAQEKGHQDDYTDLLPMYIQTNKQTAGQGKSNYETAILKSEKAIKLHSIKKRPQMSGNKKRTPKQKEYLKRKEYNPYLHNAWMMLGKSQFNKGDFIEAAATFNYIIRLYATQPEITGIAKAWLARCYVAQEWPYDAEDVLDKMRRDTITPQAQRERNNTQAAFYIQTEQYDKAIPLMRKTIQHTSRKLQRSRLNFLTGQMQMQLGQDRDAYKSFQRVIRSNPPYELQFNARIRQTEVMSRDKFRSMIKKLQRMAKNYKNKDYLDQVYYAIGNIYLANADTLRCIGAWEKGAEESTRNGIAKAVLLLRLSQLYWDRENYVDAQRTYQACIGILSKEHEEYDETQRRSKALDETAPHLANIKLQDSLQALAKLPEKEYLAAIDRVIEALKKKEKEEAKRNANAANSQSAQAAQNNLQRPNTLQAGGKPGGAWYFYNMQTVQQGKQDFQRRWGQRPNEDHWRRSNKRDELKDDSEGYNYDEEEEFTDSLGTDSGIDEEEQRRLDSIANDPHHREFYLRQIPFTEEQLAASNQILEDGLFNGGILTAEKIQNYPYATRLLERLLADFPETGNLAAAYYQLFLLYGRLQDEAQAQHYRQLLVETFPDDKNSILVTNPNYERIARDGKHMEDSLYAATYEAYLADQYNQVDTNYQAHTRDFLNGQHRARMLFVQAMSRLYSGDRKQFLELLEELISKHGSEAIAELAGSIVKGVKEGRLLSDSKYDSSDIWKRRRNYVAEGDSVQQDTLKEDRFVTFNFVIAYPTNSLDEDQLLFEVARYNFTSYMVRNFEIEITEDQGLSLMAVRGFLSYDEVHAYAQRLYADPHMHERLEGLRTLLISDDNLKLLGTSFSFDDYKDFYDEKFAPIAVPEDFQFDEPDVPFIDPDDVEPAEEPQSTDAPADDYDDFPFGF